MPLHFNQAKNEFPNSLLRTRKKTLPLNPERPPTSRLPLLLLVLGSSSVEYYLL